MKDPKPILLALSEASELHIDGNICLKLKTLAESEDAIKASELKMILDECAYWALASDFVMMAMKVLWLDLVENEKSS